MPLYEVFHVSPMAPAAQDELANAITRIHARIFTVPSIFVNVEFHEVVSQAFYIGGKRKRVNRIIAHVRNGASRTNKHYQVLTKAIGDAWLRIVCDVDLSGPTVFDKDSGKMTGEYERKINDVPEHLTLNTVLIMGSIIAGHEKGMDIPEAGKDREWILDNLEYFKQRSAEGDEDWAELLDEVRERDDFKGLLPEEEGEKSAEAKMVEEEKKKKEKDKDKSPYVPETHTADEKMRLAGLMEENANKHWKDSNVRLAQARVANENAGGATFGERIGSIFTGTTASSEN